MSAMCNNSTCALRSTCYNYVKIPNDNQYYLNMHHLTNLSPECINYVETDESDIILAHKVVDARHKK